MSDSQILDSPESESDIEFDDSQIETPRSIRNSKNGKYTQTIEVPLNDIPGRHFQKTPEPNGSPSKPKSPEEIELELIRTEKLITDDNQYTPIKPLSPKRNILSQISLLPSAKTATSPRRSSPLRQEVLVSSSSSKSPNATKHFLDRINSRLDTLNTEETPDESDDDVVLESLDNLVPEAKKEKPLTPKKKNSFLRSSPEITAKVTKPKIKQRKTTYPAWSDEKWMKLKQLVELPVPINAIINSKLVMKELGANRAELAKRVEFLKKR